jgi:hypothetical protein
MRCAIWKIVFADIEKKFSETSKRPTIYNLFKFVRQTVKHTDRCADSQTVKQTVGQTHSQIDTQTFRQSNRQSIQPKIDSLR